MVLGDMEPSTPDLSKILEETRSNSDEGEGSGELSGFCYTCRLRTNLYELHEGDHESSPFLFPFSYF